MAQNHVISQSARCIKESESEYSFFSMRFHVSLQCFHKLGNTKIVLDSNRSMILLFHTSTCSRVFLHRLEDLMMQTGTADITLHHRNQGNLRFLYIQLRTKLWAFNFNWVLRIQQPICPYYPGSVFGGPCLSRVLNRTWAKSAGSVVNLLMYSRGQEGFTPNQWRDLHSFPLECAPSTLFFRENIHICFAKPFNFPQHLTTKQEE